MSANANNGDSNHSTAKKTLDNRVLIAVSLLLGVICWLVFAVFNGGQVDKTVANVPVQLNLTGTTAEQLKLTPFWPSAASLDDLHVTVVVTARSYEDIKREDLNAQLLVSDVSQSGPYNLTVQVTKTRPNDARFEIKSYAVAGRGGQTTVPVYFDYERTLSFELTPSVLGDVKVPEGYYAGELTLLKKFVSIMGPQQKINQIAGVRAEITVDHTLAPPGETFADISIVPVDASGAPVPQYLKIETGVTATIPVWKRATLNTSVDFLNAPEAYLSRPLPFAMNPATVRAALPEGSIAPDGSCVVGAIDFHALAPGHGKKTFQAADLNQIAFLDGAETFTATVDLTGMGTVTLNLPAGNISAGETPPDAPEYNAAFQDVPKVTVVGPEEVIQDLRPEDLAGLARMDAGNTIGANQLDVDITVQTRNDCWVYGSYKVTARLTEG